MVVSLGKLDGLRKTHLLDVVRDGKRVAKLRVQLVGDKSVAKIVGDPKTVTLQKGDVVRSPSPIRAADSSQP